MAWLEHRRSGAWRVCWRQDGARQQETFGTEAEAGKFRQSVEGVGNRWPPGWKPGVGWDADPKPGVLTLRDWAQRDITNRPRVTERTRADYLRDLELHVYPMLGHLALTAITEDDVAAWDAQLARAGLSAKTRANLRGLVSSVLEDALRRRQPLAEHNPFRLYRGATHDDELAEMTFLTPAEFRLLLAHMPARYIGLTVLLAGTGLRFGEATALHVRDIHAHARTLTVVKAWKRQPDGSYVLGPPKTRHSRRTITISHSTLAALPLKRADRELQSFVDRDPNELLFRAVEGGSVRSSKFYEDGWRPALQASHSAGLTKSPRVHDLRHSHVAWLIAAGVPLPVIQRRLGHSSIRTTIDRYGHLLPDLQSGVDVAIDQALDPED